jgi:VanZ family protein
MPEHRQRSAAALLALVYGVLVLYASLYPFEGWRWPPGQTLSALLWLPRSVYHVSFDVVSNLVGYMPLGALLTLALRRPGARALAAWLQAVLLCTGLSYGCEALQQLVPARVPAVEDLALNAAGGALGALLGLSLHALGLVARWQALRQRWFASDGAFALALLVMWPVGLLFPAPVPLGLGQVGERLREWLAELLADVPWAQAAHLLLAAPPTPAPTMRPLAETVLVAAGLLAPCLVAYSVMAPGLRRVVMAVGALLLGVVGMTLSTLLNFGPSHALAWLTDRTVPGMGLGLALALVLVPTPRRLAAGLGLMALTGLVVGVAQAPADPYFAQSLQAWEQGRFVRFHGLAQWVGWLWPYAAMGWLLARLGARA